LPPEIDDEPYTLPQRISEINDKYRFRRGLPTKPLNAEEKRLFQHKHSYFSSINIFSGAGLL
jgi:hypothetical protein